MAYGKSEGSEHKSEPGDEDDGRHAGEKLSLIHVMFSLIAAS